MNDQYYRIRDEIAWRKMKDGTVTIVSPVAEKIVSINATAGMIWDLLDGAHGIDAIVDHLEGTFEKVDRPTLEQDVREILRDLSERHIIEQIVDKKSA